MTGLRACNVAANLSSLGRRCWESACEGALYMLGEAQEEANGKGGEHKNDRTSNETDGDGPPTKEFVGRMIRLDTKGRAAGLPDGGRFACPHAYRCWNERLEQAHQKEADSDGIAGESAEEDEDADGAPGSDTKGCAEQGDGRDAATGRTNESAVTILGGEIFR